MPDPGKYDNESDWMAACVPKRVAEGNEQDQAVAACLGMWRDRGKEASSRPFMVWKDAGGGYRWLAIYSNKWRDNDNPPEILAEAAHKEFVDAVDKGEWPMPELWLWHVRGTRTGAADFVAYDDSGFALASGTIDKGKEAVAARLAARPDLAVSHGMPPSEIRRDKADPTIITRYRTREISPLPRWAAANKHGTGFTILSKEADMAVPEKKRSFLEEVMGEGAVEELERQDADKAQALDAQGVESKEAVAEEATQEEPQKEDAEAPAPDAAAEAPQYVTHDELTEIFGGYVKPLIAQVQGLSAQLAAAAKELKEQQALIKELQADDEEKLKQAMAQTPAASLFARVGSVIGADETFVDGRTKLAQSKPKEAPADADGPTPVSYLNQLMARQQGG